MAAPLEIEPLGERHLTGAGALLAERHRRQRLSEPLLLERYEDPAECAEQISDLFSAEGVIGAVALRDGQMVGYMAGGHMDEPLFPANAFVKSAGHAASEPEVVRDLYAALAGRWVDRGNTRHSVLVPTHDGAVLDAWWRLGFGLQHVMALQPVAPRVWPAGVRPATDGDVEGLMALADLVSETHLGSPVFSGIPVDPDDDGTREFLHQLIADDDKCLLVAEAGGRIAATLELAPVEESKMHEGLMRVDGQILLGFAATAPEARGAGLAGALTDAAFAWSAERGLTTMAVDWRVANLAASRLWARQGFRPSFYRLYRSIP